MQRLIRVVPRSEEELEWRVEVKRNGSPGLDRVSDAPVGVPDRKVSVGELGDEPVPQRVVVRVDVGMEMIVVVERDAPGVAEARGLILGVGARAAQHDPIAGREERAVERRDDARDRGCVGRQRGGGRHGARDREPEEHRDDEEALRLSKAVHGCEFGVGSSGPGNERHSQSYRRERSSR